MENNHIQAFVVDNPDNQPSFFDSVFDKSFQQLSSESLTIRLSQFLFSVFNQLGLVFTVRFDDDTERH